MQGIQYPTLVGINKAVCRDIKIISGLPEVYRQVVAKPCSNVRRIAYDIPIVKNRHVRGIGAAANKRIWFFACKKTAAYKR